MPFLAILLSLFFGVAVCQTSCGMSPETVTFTPVVMRYTPSMTPQIPPISTIWEQIVTTWYNAVDCRYVTPLRVDENPAAEGGFTTYVRSPTLTVTRVGCMPETTAVTRRNLRGDEQVEPKTIAAEIQQQQKMQKRGATIQAVDRVIDNVPDSFPPPIMGLTVQAYRYLTSMNTAIFAVNLVEAGIDLNQTCSHLRDPATQARLFRTTVDPVQAGDVVCFAANNGLYSRVPLSDVVTQLADLVYAVQIRSQYDEDSEEFCWPINTSDWPFLGIDWEGVAEYLCSANPTVIGPRPESSSQTSTAAPSNVSHTGGGAGTFTTAATSSQGPWSNSTGPQATVTNGSGYNFTLSPSGATATSAPFANSTANSAETASTTSFVGTAGPVGTAGSVGTAASFGSSIIFPNATWPVVGTGTGWATGNLPPAPTVVSPPIESVSSTPTRRIRKW